MSEEEKRNIRQKARQYASREWPNDDVVVPYSAFISGYDEAQSRISELEKENAELREALQEITRTNWMNGKYFGMPSAMLHTTTCKIAEQALNKEGE